MAQEPYWTESRIAVIALAALLFLPVGLFEFHSAMNRFIPFVATTIERLRDPNTKLGVFERRIAGVNFELVRRSPRMRELINDFGACYPKCPDSIYRRRDEIVREEWPELFARIRVKSDWVPHMMRAYEQVEDLIDEYGEEAPVRCVPKIGLSYTKVTGPYTVFEKFVCIPPEVPLPRG